MDQERILARITAMVDDERELRDALTSGDVDSATGRLRLGQLERDPDRCWDLPSRRRAKSGFGEDPDDARVRPSSWVGNYRNRPSGEGR